MIKFRQFFRYGIFVGAVTGSIIALERNDWDVSTLGLVRFGRAAYTVTSIAVDYKMNLTSSDHSSAEYKNKKSEVHYRSARKLLDLCNTNGGVFIKVGQHLGALEYLLPYEYVSTMKVLHSSAPKSPLKDILKVIEEDLQAKPDDIFSHFDREPLGAASLAQVHKATLKNGKVVAVKVQHPHVQAHSFVDMKTMELLVNIVAVLFPEFKFMWLADETKKNLPIELQFLNEGKNAELAARIFKRYSWLKIPKIFWDLSTNRVLTMEFCEGGQVNDIDYMKRHKIDTELVSERLGLLYSNMIFVEGHVHCDPHPGNIFVHATSKGPQIVLLDHGLYQTLNADFRTKYCNLWLALLSADVEKIKVAASALGVTEKFGLLSAMVTARSWAAVKTGIQKQKVTKEETEHIRENVAKFLPQITEVLDKVPREMILILKTNDLLRGIEFSLKRTPGTSFIPMTRFCLYANYKRDLDSCKTTLCKLKIMCFYAWLQFRVSVQAMFIRLINLIPRSGVS